MLRIRRLLDDIGDGFGSHGAASAFERIAPNCDYNAAKTLFESADVFKNSERSVELIAQMALAADQRSDAIGYLAILSDMAEENGSWGGGWRNDIKQRYHRLNVALNGKSARIEAFDAFTEDLAKRREHVGYLMADLAEVIDLLSPRPTWPECWNQLKCHLAEFREHRLGQELQALPSMGETEEVILADILYRAFETTATELGNMARAAAVELTNTPAGSPVVAALIRRLWHGGGQMALEAAQIAWECRDTNAVRDGVVPILQEMCDSNDIAVRNLAMTMGSLWGQWPRAKHAELPPFYQLKLEYNPLQERFDPPSGYSSTSAGLYTEDHYAWTWPLKRPLQIASEASGIDLAHLRARAGQFMAPLAALSAFGPAADTIQRNRLRRLGILKKDSWCHCVKF